MRRAWIILWTVCALLAAAPSVAPAARPQPFAIEVVDEQSGRGVPLVELKTVSNVRYYTDSAGLAPTVGDPASCAFTDPKF